MKYLFEINDFYKQQSRSPGKSRPKISKKLLITNFVNISGIAIFHCLARILIEVQVFCFEYIKINQSQRCISLVFTEKLKTVIFQLVLYLHLYSGKDVVYEQEENHNFLFLPNFTSKDSKVISLNFFPMISVPWCPKQKKNC